MDWSKFNSQVDLAGLKNDVKSAKENGSSFDEAPVGTYEVKCEKLELGESKAGDPMVKGWFKIVEGDYKNTILFYNQVITRGFQINIVGDFLESMDVPNIGEIEFDDYVQFGNLLDEIYLQIQDGWIAILEYGKKGNFPTFKITETFWE